MSTSHINAEQLFRLPPAEFEKFFTQLQKRSAVLRRKQLQTRLTSAEQRELEILIQQMEQLDVERLQRLAELARLRNVSLSDLMQQLGLEPAK